MIKIRPVKSANKKDLADMNRLLRQLSASARKLDMRSYRRLLANKNLTLFAARDGRRIVGMGSLVLMEIPVAFRTRMEDVIVDSEYRTHGLGTKIIQTIVATAKKKGGISVDLTTRFPRAGKFYKKMGFKKRKTEVYRMDLK